MGIRKQSLPGRSNDSSRIDRYAAASMGRAPNPESSVLRKENPIRSLILGDEKREDFHEKVWQPERRKLREAARKTHYAYKKQERAIEKYFDRGKKTKEFERTLLKLGITEESPEFAEKKITRDLAKQERKTLRKMRDERKQRKKQLWKDFSQSSRQDDVRKSGLSRFLSL